MTEFGNEDGWRYAKTPDGWITATKTYEFDSVASYTTLAGGYGGYSVSNILLPFKMLSDNYSVYVDGMVGNSFTLYASAVKTAEKCTVYLMSSATGTQKIKITVTVMGYLA